MTTRWWTELSSLVIQGVSESGQAFRPSDWDERLCGMMSVFGENRHPSHSPYLKPVVIGGLRCVVVDLNLEAMDVSAFRFLMSFARDNELKLRPGRKAKRPDEIAAGPVTS